MMATYSVNDVNCKKRESYHVTYTSGMAGIGKTAFGLGGIRSALAASTVDSDFAEALRRMNYIQIELNGGGDGWRDGMDENLTPVDRFNVRFFSRACHAVSYTHLTLPTIYSV